MLSRRRFTALAGLGLIAPPLALAREPAVWSAHLRELEAAAQGRLGVCILDTAAGQSYGHRADERFMMLSSFKLLACALVLHRVDAGLESMQRRMAYTARDLVPWSPITEKHVDQGGMSLSQLCEATLTTSDNTAANLILASYGGPTALTAYARQLGDAITRLDRTEPGLNVKTADGLMDTTTPRAMLDTLHKLLLGDALRAPSRSLLQQWLSASTTGTRRLKAGLPADWRIGEKTGTNDTDANDIGIVWPPGRPPVLVTAYLADSRASPQAREATLAQVGQLVSRIVMAG
jgi:beta-lactamase class A